MAGELATTNLLLGIMAAVSVLEALALIGLGIAGFMAYKNVMEISNMSDSSSPTRPIELKRVQRDMEKSRNDCVQSVFH